MNVETDDESAALFRRIQAFWFIAALAFVAVMLVTWFEFENSALENCEVESSALENSALENSALENCEVESSALENCEVENCALENCEVENCEVENCAPEDSLWCSWCGQDNGRSWPFQVCPAALVQVILGVVAALLLFASFFGSARLESTVKKWFIRVAGTLLALAPLTIHTLLLHFPKIPSTSRLVDGIPLDVAMSVLIAAGLWVYIAGTALFFASPPDDEGSASL